MMRATVFADLSASKAGAVPLGNLLATIAAGRPHRDAKAACPLFSPFEFGAKRTQKGSLRSTDNAREACAIVAEHDGETITPEDARDKLAAFGIEATLYTTASHAPEAPRWRIVCPTSRGIGKDEYAHMVARLNGLFGGALASESFTVAQAFYFGRVDGRPFVSYASHGEPIDVLHELDAQAYYPGNAAADGGFNATNTDAHHRDTIRTGGDGVQRALLALAARWTARGMTTDDITAALLGLIDACEWKDRDPARWRIRRASIARCVATAASKFGDKREPSADAASEDAESADGDPQPIPLDLLKQMAAPPLRVEDVPGVLGVFAESQARATGFDVSILLAAGIGAACAALSDEVRLCVASRSDWFESARLWIAIVGGPGAGKSPGSKAALAPIFALHREGIAAWVKEYEDADDPPTMPALYVNDATTEALADVLKQTPRGLIYFVDELESWLASHDAYRSGVGKDRGEWLRLYDGGPHQINRVKRGAFFVPNWGVSLLSATTPAALRKLAPKLPNDGLLQRLLLVLARPRELPDEAMLRVETRQPAAAWDTALRRLHATAGGVVRLSSAAREAFEHEQAELHRLTGAFEDAHQSFAAHVAKRPAMLVRLALAFHALETLNVTDELAGPTMAKAARFLRRQERHAQAAYGSMFAADTGMALAKDIGRAILASRLEWFNRRELTPRCKAFRHADEPTRQAALTLLSDCGWIFAESHASAYGAVWTVDRRVHELYAEHGEAARQRRETIRSRFAEADQ